MFVYKLNKMRDEYSGWPIFKELASVGRTLVGFHLQPIRGENAKEEEKEKKRKNYAVHFTEDLFKFIFEAVYGYPIELLGPNTRYWGTRKGENNQTFHGVGKMEYLHQQEVNYVYIGQWK